MKRLIILIVLLTGALCNVSAQERLRPTHTSTTKSDEIKSFITVYHRYAIFLCPISPSTEISELQAGINYYCIIVAN